MGSPDSWRKSLKRRHPVAPSIAARFETPPAPPASRLSAPRDNRGRRAQSSKPNPLGSNRSSTMRVVGRRKMQARRHGFIRDDPIGFTAHDAVAFAGSFLEPRPVNFDQAPPIGSDSTNGTEFGNHQCHGRSSHSKQLRKRLQQRFASYLPLA